jgi:hypothetical protein
MVAVAALIAVASPLLSTLSQTIQAATRGPYREHPSLRAD